MSVHCPTFGAVVHGRAVVYKHGSNARRAKRRCSRCRMDVHVGTESLRHKQQLAREIPALVGSRAT